ncbi:MAG TPA: hydrogenase nickel incorporation protein HypB [Candidatus Binatia bacterium]|jgi:hydrogenase nickel incorporation protein HypB|nr:hydrogenase nickel incorporation protein HypB [Candidatus Binatia bacterium]
MCRDCGCGLPGEEPTGISAHHHEHEHSHAHPYQQSHGQGEEHDHEHPHDHEHQHEHEHGPGLHHGESHAHPHTHFHTHSRSHEDVDHDHEHSHARGGEARRTVELRQAILAKNDRLAERNRGFFRARGLLVLNVLSSPGSGKTTFLKETLRTLGGQLKAGVIVGDLATDNDAQKLRESGAPVVQITTGTVCHLEAEMVTRAVKHLTLDGLDLLIIENVGNLVCPASYDLGEDLRVVLLAVTEGEDKPLKYPPMFQSADVVIISKIDLAEACMYNREAAMANLRRVAAKARVIETSAKTGKGMDAWRDFLIQQQKERKSRDPLGVER